MTTSKTMTARQLVREKGYDLDLVFNIVNQHGMDSRKLRPSDISLITGSLSGVGTGVESTLEDSMVQPISSTDGLIVRIHNDKERTTRYMFASDLPSIGNPKVMENEMSFEEFIGQIETGIDYTPGTRRTGTGGGGKRGRSQEITIHGKLADFLLANRDRLELKSSLYGESRDEPIDVTALLRSLVPDSMVDNLRANYNVDTLTPAALMKMAKKAKERRIKREVKEYFLGGGGQFITSRGDDGFDLSWTKYDDIVHVVKWLEPRIDEPERGLPFYVNAVHSRLDKELTSAHGSVRNKSRVRGHWVTGASSYEFAKSHPYTKKKFQGTSKPKSLEELSFEMVKEFAGNEKYNGGDSRRFMVGLFVAGKVDTSDAEGEKRPSQYHTALRRGSDVDYLLTRYDEIDSMARNVVGRIKAGDLKEDVSAANQKLYAKVQAGEYEIKGKREALHLRRAIVAQMSDEEKALFGQRGKGKEDQTLADQTVDRLLGWYVRAEKDSLLS